MERESGVMLSYGGVPVPFTTSWTGEARTFVGLCPHARCDAIRQESAPGAGKPVFAYPHFDRQRKAIAERLCDLCGKPLKTSTKVSLSHARPIAHSARGFEILQVEPMLHRDCAAICLQHCPSLKRDIAAGTLHVRQVFAHEVQFAIGAPQFVGEYVPGFEANPTDTIVAHAKFRLVKWADRDDAWLRRAS